MKTTGVVRKVDRLGRIVLPISIRKHFNIQIDDPMEIYIDGEQIVLRKYEPACIFCDNADNIILWNGKRICRSCVEKIKTEI